MCKWYCTSEGPSTNLKCKSCGCGYCGACLHGDAGKMKKLTQCARCGKKPTVVPAGQNASWQCVAAFPENVDFSAQGVEPASGGHVRIGGVSSNMQEYSSMCRTPDQAAPVNPPRARAAKGCLHPDQVDRIKIECHVCGYKCFPQWMNDQAHCLKCNVVLRTRPSCQQRSSNPVSPARVDSPQAVPTPEVSTLARKSRSLASSSRSSPQNAPVHSDLVDRVKMECHACGYKSFPQWMNDQAHCLKCDSVLRTRPSCQQRHFESPNSTAATIGLRARHNIRDAFSQLDTSGNGVISLAKLNEVLQRLPVPVGQKPWTDADFERLLEHMDENRDGDVDFREFTNWAMNDYDDAAYIMQMMRNPNAATVVTTSSPRGRNRPSSAPGVGMAHHPQGRAVSRPAARGPERFFYDKASYTGTHARGGPDHVAKGLGTSINQSWKRPGI